MWSVWLVFCDCSFHSVGLLMDKDKKLMEADVRDWLRGKLGLVLHKSLIRFLVDGQGCFPSLFQTMVEVMKIMVTSFRTSHELLHWVPPRCSRPTLNHTFAGDSWTLTGKSRSVSFGITAPFCWVLVHPTFCLSLQESVSPFLCKFWQLYGGVNGDLIQEDLCHTQICCTHSPCPTAGYCWPISLYETLKHSSNSFFVGCLGPGVQKFCLSLPSVSGGYEVWVQMWFNSSYCLAGASP